MKATTLVPGTAALYIFTVLTPKFTASGTTKRARLLGPFLSLAMDGSQRRWLGRRLCPGQGPRLANDHHGEGQPDNRCWVSDMNPPSESHNTNGLRKEKIGVRKADTVFFFPRPKVGKGKSAWATPALCRVWASALSVCRIRPSACALRTGSLGSPRDRPRPQPGIEASCTNGAWPWARNTRAKVSISS